MGAPSKKARKIRQGGEFDIARIAAAINPPKEAPSVYSWSLEQIFAARNEQMRGHFRTAARLAESMRTDDALAVAFENRLAPQRCIKLALTPAKGGHGAKIAAEAESLFGKGGVGLHPDTLADIHGCIVNHGVAFAQVVLTAREDGSRLDSAVRYWPIEHVRWDAYDRCFKTRTEDGVEEQIHHGDGRWVIFQKHEHEPFKHGALMPAALVWGRHAFAIRDWAKGSVSHGNAKVIGEMPEGVALQGADGQLTAEAAAFLELLRAVASADVPVGIKPSGSKTEYLTNGSSAWQVWNELVQNAEKAAARVYLGTDGTMGASGGAPGVDITALFGVASTIVEGDLKCIERGVQTGVIEPWAAVNFGTSKDVPSWRYTMPDADAETNYAALGTRRQAFFADIKAAREEGAVITQEYVDAVAKQYGVEGFLLPAETDAKAPTIELAPTDIANVVSVNEARASAGLGPLMLRTGGEDPDGYLSVGEYKAKLLGSDAPRPALRAIDSAAE